MDPAAQLKPCGEGAAGLQAVIWKWLWRFCLLTVGLTLLLGAVAGVVVRHLSGHVPPWLGGLLAVLAVVMAAGLLLPGLQRDLRRVHGDEHSPAGDAPGAQAERKLAADRRERRGGSGAR